MIKPKPLLSLKGNITASGLECGRRAAKLGMRTPMSPQLLATGSGPPGEVGLVSVEQKQPSVCRPGDGEGDVPTPSATMFPIRRLASQGREAEQEGSHLPADKTTWQGFTVPTSSGSLCSLASTPPCHEIRVAKGRLSAL